MTDDGKPIYEKLEWGHGPRILDVFLEPTCPFCTLAFGKLRPLLDQAGEDRMTIRIHMHSQPWHLFSGAVVRAIIAASGTSGGKQAAYDVMARVFEHREDFICTDHCSGPNMDISTSDILRRIAELTGLDLRQDFERKEVTDVMKRHARFARQNGVHMSPTFMIDGLIVEKMSSGDDVSKWMADLGLPAINA